MWVSVCYYGLDSGSGLYLNMMRKLRLGFRTGTVHSGRALQGSKLGATTFSITTLAMMGSFATLRINDIQHNASVVMRNAAVI
jgi:hypothetical protein